MDQSEDHFSPRLHFSHEEIRWFRTKRADVKIRQTDAAPPHHKILFSHSRERNKFVLYFQATAIIPRHNKVRVIEKHKEFLGYSQLPDELVPIVL